MDKKSDSSFELEEGSAEVTLEDVYKMFYTLVNQNQRQRPGSKMGFDLRIFKNLPKKLQLAFENKNGKLFVWIPSKKPKKKSRLWTPKHKIVTPN